MALVHLVAGTHPAPTPQCLLRQLTGLSQGSNLGTGFWYRVEQTFGLRKDRNHLDCPPGFCDPCCCLPGTVRP